MRERMFVWKSRFFCSVGLSAVLLSARGPEALAQGQADPMLNREDSPRSQFAGAGMRRVQSYGQPLGGASSGIGSETGVPVGAATQTVSGAGTSAPGQMPTRVYKDVPLTGVYLNGVSVVGLRNQTLRGVIVRFDEQGNVLIEAPHYDVQVDASFHPLLPGEAPARAKDAAPWPGELRSPSKQPSAAVPAAAEPGATRREALPKGRPPADAEPLTPP